LFMFTREAGDYTTSYSASGFAYEYQISELVRGIGAKLDSFAKL